MKPFTSFFGLPLGISSTFWFLVGLIRYCTEMIHRFRNPKRVRNTYRRTQIAAIIPAHNEEIVIRKCIQALKRSLNPSQIHVVSDGSGDKTYRRARMEGCHVSYLNPGLGKAKAIMYVLRRYHILETYEFVFIIDADTRIDRYFVRRALPLFNDPAVGVVYGSARITWPPHIVPKLKFYFVAYRERLNRMLHFFFAYGQTWKYTNTTYVIPGFATIFRSNIFGALGYDTPGLLIEDFNTAFKFHKLHLGKIAYNPECIGWDQHPETLRDYWKQVRRWNIGFFQTVRLNGVWPSWFWASLGLFTIEIFLNSLYILCLPVLLVFLIFQQFPVSYPWTSAFVTAYQAFGPFRNVRLFDIFLSIYIIDYGITVALGLMYKKPQFILYGPFFIFMHYVTSLILVTSVIPGFFTRSVGRWVSPERSTEQLSVNV